MSKLHSLKGRIQNYAWGGHLYIPHLLNIQAEDKPYAEYWLGAHANAPAELSDLGQKLDAYIDSDVKGILGEAIASAYGRLPFLFKVLDVNDMLSIQVHPNKEEAVKGFAKENELGIPLKAPNRNYKDDNHKPEIMVALSEFWLLHGFLPEDQLSAILKQTPEFSELIEVFERESYLGLYKKVMNLSEEESDKILQPLIDRVLLQFEAGQLEKSSPDYWAAKAYLTFCKDGKLDKGIYSIYFFNIVKLNPGEAVFQDAGIPHAYIEGQNMELMANSDNVLRGGLTPKHVDVPELLKHVVFEATHPNVMKGELQADRFERIYKCPAPDFQLSKIEISSGDQYQSETKTAEIIIVIDGDAEVSENGNILKMKKGGSCFLEAGIDYRITSLSTSTMYKATAP